MDTVYYHFMKQIDPRNIKALALDLDGTILRPDTTLSGRMTETLKACRERGIQLVICTGRSVGAAEVFRVPLGAEGPMVYFNGAEVVDMPGARVLETNLLEAEAVEFCVDMARAMDVHYHIFFSAETTAAGTGVPVLPAAVDAAAASAIPVTAVPADAGTAGTAPEILMIERDGPEAEMYRRRTGLVPVIGDIKKAIGAPGVQGCIKGMFIAEKAAQDTIRRELARRFGGRLYVAGTHATFLEVMAAGVSKGRGLETVMKHRRLAPGEVLALGDEENDLPMFGVAGFSAAPANAGEKIRAAADHVFGSNAEDGAAAFLEEIFGLPAASRFTGSADSSH
jgi:hydroxymethylpyrimidine pyrophosphatase-like HAD family hydrolase